MLPPCLVALHLGWGTPDHGGTAEMGRGRAARAEMSRPGKSNKNAKCEFFNTRKSQKKPTAQTCPGHAAVPEPVPGRCKSWLCLATTISPAGYFPLAACSYKVPCWAGRCPGGSHAGCSVPEDED